MRTYRLWYALDVSYADGDKGDIQDAIRYGEEITAMISEHVKLMKMELVI